MEATRNGRMEISDGDGDKKCERCSSGESTNNEEEKKKSVYVVMTEYPGPRLRVLRIDPHDANRRSGGFQDITPKKQGRQFDGLYGYGVAALEPNLYFVGGVYRGGRFSNQVLVFNTCTGYLDSSIPPMRLCRPSPKVFICDKKIYVFGYDRMPMKSFRPKLEDWAEIYDPATQKWNNLNSVNKPPCNLVDNGCTATAFCEEQQCILFYVQAEHLYGYKVDKGLWFQVKENLSTRFDLGCCDTIALHKGLLFWHHEGIIFADRLPQDFPSSQLITLSNAPYLCGHLPSGEPSPLSNSFLVNAGNGVLGLLYQCFIATCPKGAREWIAFHRFKLRHRPSDDAPSLHSSHYCRTHPIRNSLTVDVLVM